MRKTALWQIAAASAMTMAAGCGQPLDQTDEEAAVTPSVQTTFPKHRAPAMRGVHMKQDSGIRVNSPRVAAAAQLQYYGGHVLASVKPVTVFWNGSVSSVIKDTMPGFYQAIVQSAHMDWLSEYDTNITAVGGQPGTNQHIGRGSYGGTFTLTPKNSNTSVTNTDIQTELTAQINGGTLPKPDADTIYMIHFPAGMSIDLNGSKSCQVFCAYHNTWSFNGKNQFYAVMPDLTSGGCEAGCGTSGEAANTESASSHELIEAVTDAEVGVATMVGPPLAWYDQSQGEIGDICNGQQGPMPGNPGYTVQKEWSNKAGACITDNGGGGGGDTTPPTVNLTSPADGTAVSGVVNVGAEASDPDDAVASVEFFANGKSIGVVNAAPFTVPWNSKSVADGNVAITATARDTHGNAATSGTVTVRVANAEGGGDFSESEPNNGRSTANALPDASFPGTVNVAGYINPDGDRDFFKLHLAPGKSLTVDLVVPQASDFDLYVYDSKGRLIARSENDVGVAEHILVKNTGTQTFARFIEVRYYSGASNTNPYKMPVKVQ